MSRETLRCAASLIEAADQVAQLHPGFWLDLAPRMTCIEADAVRTLIAAIYTEDVGREFMQAHEVSDDEDDDHYPGEAVTARVERLLAEFRRAIEAGDTEGRNRTAGVLAADGCDWNELATQAATTVTELQAGFSTAVNAELASIGL